MTKITFTLETRPGALTNATIERYQTSRDDPTGRYKVMLVPDRKHTFSGPAPVSLNKEVQQLCDDYVQHIRLQFASHLPPNLL